MAVTMMDSSSQGFERNIQLARTEALRYLAYGSKTSGKIRTKLKEKNFAPEVVDETLRQLTQDGYIKDQELIESTWRGRRGVKCEAVEAFCLRMRRLGISEQGLERFRESHPPEREDKASLEEYLTHKYSLDIERLRAEGECGLGREDVARLVRSAQSHGYRLHLIISLLAEWGLSLNRA